jgi:hypothetical protein
MGPYLLPYWLNAQHYCVFLQTVLPGLLEDVPQPVQQGLWFQHDGARPDKSENVWEWLDLMYPRRWIGRGRSIACPPHSPDLTPLDFSYPGHL